MLVLISILKFYKEISDALKNVNYLCIKNGEVILQHFRSIGPNPAHGGSLGRFSQNDDDTDFSGGCVRSSVRPFVLPQLFNI